MVPCDRQKSEADQEGWAGVIFVGGVIDGGDGVCCGSVGCEEMAPLLLSIWIVCGGNKKAPSVITQGGG